MRPSMPDVATVLICFGLCAAVAPVSTVAAQTKKPLKTPKTITLSGCIQPDDTAPDRYTITDTKAGTTYRLIGTGLRDYLGSPVQVDGGVVVKGITIKGGLQPNPNVAAQAGAIDPGRAAIASSPGSAPVGSVDNVAPQDFRVKTVRRGAGSCQ